VEVQRVNNPLSFLLLQNNISVQIYGLPGTYKTTFLLQVIQMKLVEEDNRKIFLIDTSGNFPLIRLKSVKSLLKNLVIFHPKTLKETALLLDDFNIQYLSRDSILLIDDVFRHVNLENKKNIHLNSYILALIKAISKEINFPVILTNQARSFDNLIRPFLQNLTIQYLDWHFLFEKSLNKKSILVSRFKKEEYIDQKEYTLNNKGYFPDVEF
jgi:hypothetical protein